MIASCAEAEQTLVETLVPPGCTVSAGPDDDAAEPLFEAEAAVVAAALAKRRREFALGRMHARRALGRLGCEGAAIGVREDRAPIWPAGVVGSITHTRGLVAATTAWEREIAGLGLDVESRERPMRETLDRFILTAGERAALADALPQHFDPVRLVFSAKEAVHKCIAPMSGVTLGFHEVELDFDAANGRFTVRLVSNADPRLPDFGRLDGRFVVTESYVAAVASAAV